MARQDIKQVEKQNVNRNYLSVEQKLQLSHMMRQEQDYNRMQMDEREMFVYGALHKKNRRRNAKYAGGGKSPGGYGAAKGRAPGMLTAAEEEAAEEEAWEKEQKRNRISLMIRGFAAVLLFTIVLLMRFENLSIGGVDYQNLIDSLRSREFINGIDFEELMPYTNEEQTLPEGGTSGNQGGN